MSTGPHRQPRLADQILATMADSPPHRAWRVAELAAALAPHSHGALHYAIHNSLLPAGLVEVVHATKPRTVRLTTAGHTRARQLRAATASAVAAGPPTGPAPTGSSAPAGRVTGPIRRPNGSLYHPRMLGDNTDVALLRRLRDRSIPVLLAGPPGCGKTSLIEAAFPDAITLAGDGDTTVADFLGDYTQDADGTYTFHHGPLVVAMRQGRALFVDDATLIPPPVQAVLYPAMDGRGTVEIKAHRGEIVAAEPGFYVCGGHNPGAVGAVLDGPLASRFSFQISVATDYGLAEDLDVDPRAVRAARNLAARAAAGEVGWAPQMRELLAFRDIAAATSTPIAVANLAAIAPEPDTDAVAAVLGSAFGIPVAPLRLGDRTR